jgi:hypothetical protein
VIDISKVTVPKHIANRISPEKWAERCRWYAMCDNPPTKIEPHPTLGNVPICDRCKARVDQLR